MRKPKLGQFITSSDRLVRTRKYNGQKDWIRRGGRTGFRPAPVQGWYMGSRTKQNGYTDSDGDYATWFVRTGSREVWLIVVKDRENPIFVSPEDCTYD